MSIPNAFKRFAPCLAIGLAATMTVPVAQAQSGELVFYGYAGDHVEPLVRAFNKHYPNIKVRAVSLQGPAAAARVRAEKDNPQADVLNVGDDVMLSNTDLLQPFRIKDESAFPSWAIIRKGDEVYGYGYSLAIQMFLVNTEQMKLADAPHSWKQLLDPKYHGKFMLGNPGSTTAGYGSWAQLLQIVGKSEAPKFVNNAVFSAEANMVPQEVGRGEVAMGIVEETKAQDIKEQGYPVELVYPEEGLVPTVDGWALIKGAPHPENARLFLEFINSKEAQDINVAKRNRRVARLDGNPPKGLAPLSKLKINTAVDVEKFTADRKANVELFNQLFVKKQ